MYVCMRACKLIKNKSQRKGGEVMGRTSITLMITSHFSYVKQSTLLVHYLFSLWSENSSQPRKHPPPTEAIRSTKPPLTSIIILVFV